MQGRKPVVKCKTNNPYDKGIDAKIKEKFFKYSMDHKKKAKGCF